MKLPLIFSIMANYRTSPLQPKPLWLLATCLCLNALPFQNLRAQDDEAAPGTNEVQQTEQAVPEGAVAAEPLLEDESSETNNVAETNHVAAPGPDGRTRRLRRRPPARPRDTNSHSQTVSSPSATNGGPASLEYSAFRIVADRNIFDPNRAPRSSRPAAQPKTVDSFSLVGTMSYEKGSFAFFDGTSSEYKKVLKPEGSIAGYKVTAITPDSVKLTMNTNVLDLKVGTQMRRRDDGSWEVSAASAAYASSAPSSQHDAASAAAESDVIKKMMLRREKE